MLVIRRRPGETLLLGDDIEIEVLDIAGSQVKLGIRAPRQVLVWRKEIQITRQENVAAAGEKSGAALNSLLDTLKKLEPSPISPL
jgi:carbon storage regulator